MLHSNEFILDFMQRYNYPQAAQDEFIRVEKRLDSEEDFGGSFDAVLKDFLDGGCEKMWEPLDKITLLAQQYGENKYTLHFIFVLNCTPDLLRRYREAGISEEIYWNSMDDLRCKLIECINCRSVAGTFVGDWFGGFFDMTRFALGRFQYEERSYEFDFDFTCACGVKLTKGDRMINFHIPSSGVPLKDEIRFDSYRRAYEYYKPLFPDGRVVFWCESWLLYPEHRKFLPEKSNIIKFLNDFEIVRWGEDEKFHDAWRIYESFAGLPPEKLPADTSLRRAYTEHLKRGGRSGWGCGVFVFDGKNILK